MSVGCLMGDLENNLEEKKAVHIHFKQPISPNTSLVHMLYSFNATPNNVLPFRCETEKNAWFY